MLLFLLALAGGLVVMTYGADQFVIGSARLAKILSLSPVVIGAVVVGFGTSAPELVVSALAAARDDLAVGAGNVIGSNVANLTLILGGAAVLAPMTVRSGVLRREAPLSVGAVVLFALLLQDGFTRVEGVVLLVALAAALFLVLRGSRTDDSDELGSEVAIEFELEGHRGGPESVRTLVGLIATVGGASALVWGAEGIADRLGLSGGFVGMTLVAVGTSLPELVTALAAARHDEHELVVGNVLGSNLFNSLAVGGVIALLAPGVAVDESLWLYGAAAMVVVAVVSLVLMLAGRSVTRRNGLVLLALFAGFLALTYSTQSEDPDPGEEAVVVLGA